MRTLALCGVALLCAAAAACTVDRASDNDSPPAGATSAPAVRACPWSEERGQEYESETGRIRLVVTCLGETHLAGAGSGFVYSGPDQGGGRELRYTDGTTAAVLCVEQSGGRFADSAGHASTVWFQVDGSFAGATGDAAADGTGWVPHAATGYAGTAGQDVCTPR